MAVCEITFRLCASNFSLIYSRGSTQVTIKGQLNGMSVSQIEFDYTNRVWIIIVAFERAQKN